MKGWLIGILLLVGSVAVGNKTATVHSFHVFTNQNYYSSERRGTINCILPGGTDYSSIYIKLSNYSNRELMSFQFPDSVLKIPVDIQKLTEGTTKYRLRLYQKSSLLIDTVIDIIKLRSTYNEVKINQETGGLIVDNLPFFPFGFYCGESDRIPVSEIINGFNTMGPYQSNFASGLASRASYMDRCAQIGMKVQYGVNSLVGSGHNGDKGVDLTEDQKLDLLKSEVLTFRNHPALLSWYINDEPDGQGRDPKILEKAYNLIHELDPYHPVSIVFMMPSRFHLYSNTMDIAMTDPYPIPKSVDIRGYVQQLKKDFGTRKSIWLVPQAFGGQEMWPRETTPKELRVMTYLGLLENAKGIQYYVRSANNLNPQSVALWSECSNMAVEVNQMTPFLLSSDPQIIVSTGNEDLLAKCFSYKGYKLILVVNKANQPLTYSLPLGAVAPNTKAQLWFENRTLNIRNSILSDMIDALGTRVYLIKDSLQSSSPATYSGNLIYNPGFEEVVTPGLATGHNRGFKDESKADLDATVFTDSRQSVEGLFSLRMTTPADHSGKTIRFLPVILKAGDTYNVSIWAKAKAGDSKNHFRLALPSEKQEKTFEMSTEWKKYSFIFKATCSTTNAILELELQDKGTAWFDLVQIVADPVMEYQIVNNDKAIVSIKTISDSTRITYTTDYQTNQLDYNSPFQVHQATNINAILYKQSAKIAESALFVPVNKALGRKVEFETLYDPQYPSAGVTTLTDGVMGTTSFRDKKWLGFMHPEVRFTLDMEQSIPIHTVVTNFLSDANSGIFLPRFISIEISDDGQNFSPVAFQNNIEVSRRAEPTVVPISTECKGIKARYIKFRIKTYGEIPEGYLFKGSTSWMFMDEILIK